MSISAKFSRVIARMAVCSVLLVLPSCTIPCLRSAQPAPEMPADFDRASRTNSNDPPGVAEGDPTENSSRMSVEEFFHDPVLSSLIDQAIFGNRELKILNEEVQIARNEIQRRRGAYLPFVTYGAKVGVERNSLYTPLGAAEDQLLYPPGKHFPDPVPDFLLDLNLFWQVDIWRELRNARDAAIQRYIAACEKRNYFVTQLIAEVAEKYYDLMALDKRLENLNQTIVLQSQSLDVARAKKAAGRGTELAVRRFEAEVRKNQSEILIVRQEIVEDENRINFLLNRYPQPVERDSTGFYDLTIHSLSLGIPAQLLQFRPDVRQAERELAAAGLDVLVARAHFYPRLDITAGVGYEAFNPRYLFVTPEALMYNAAADLVGPLVNRQAIKAEYRTANARQLQALYEYQRTVLNAFTEVVNRVSKAENYSRSLEIKRQQLESLEASVDSATKLFQNARAEYVEVLLAQRDLRDARMVLIDTKSQQLAAIVNAFQALGGGDPAAPANARYCKMIGGMPVPPRNLGQGGTGLMRNVDPPAGPLEPAPLPTPVPPAGDAAPPPPPGKANLN